MAAQRPSLDAFKKQSITNIFLGIDFGTSFTKVSYSYAPTSTPQVHTIDWGGEDGFFKPTVLFIQNEKLYFDEPEGESKTVRYFKYSILERSLRNSNSSTENNFEQMCCVYYLAQIIKRSLNIIMEHLKLSSLENIKISVNMGVPLENFYQEKNKNNKGLYQELLEDAVLLAGGAKIKATLPNNQVIISNLDSVYSEILIKKAVLNWSANVYPELAAELLLYHQSKFVADGVYAIIDIGGGTVDMALFQKTTSRNTKNAYMYCLAQRVLPYGIEILKNTPKKVSCEQFQIEFAKMVMNSKNYMDVNYSQYRKVDVFFLGGGANDSWYTSNIAVTKNRLCSGGIPPLEFSRSIEDFIQEEEKLIQKNQRLIISQMLAKHSDEIDSVKGFPDFYEKEKRERPKEPEFDMEAYLSEKGDKYRD